MIKSRRPLVAAIASFFFPGLGQLYCGKWERAIIFLGGYLFILLVYFNVLLRFYPVMKYNWLWGMLLSLVPALEALFSARKGRNYELKKMNKPGFYILYIIFYSLAIVALFFVSQLNLFRYRAWGIPSDGMAPTIRVADKIVVDNWAFAFEKPKPGDVAVALLPEKQMYVVKRIIAVGEGEVVFFPAERAYSFRGRKTEYAAFLPAGKDETDEPASAAQGSDEETLLFAMKADEVFLVGDNLDNSSDSRTYGPVPTSSLVAKVLYIYESEGGSRDGKFLTE